MRNQQEEYNFLISGLAGNCGEKIVLKILLFLKIEQKRKNVQFFMFLEFNLRQIPRKIAFEFQIFTIIKSPLLNFIRAVISDLL